VIGLLGGTGDLGTALAMHIARAYDVVYLGSRSREKAESAVRELIAEKLAGTSYESHLIPTMNEEVVMKSDVIIATVPYESAIETIRALVPKFRGNQILISAAALVRKIVEIGEFKGPTADSRPLAIQIREVVPSSVKVAAGFQTVPANVLYKDRDNQTFDVLIASEDAETFSKVSAFVNSLKGLRALSIGSLGQAGEVEGLTSILLNIAIKNKLKSPTFRVESF